jgi:structure-specific endonuclease subunit SLX1
MFYVYCLATVDTPIQTYIGAATDVDRRLGQHNTGQKAGGAKRTSTRPGNWYRVCFVEGFDTWNNALSFEWHWKHFSKKFNTDPLTRRQKGLDKCIAWAFTEKGLTLNVRYE